MNTESRLRKGLFWGTLLVLAAVSGGIWFAYVYATDSKTIGPLIEAEARRYLRDAALGIGRVTVRPLLGEVTLERLELGQVIDGGPDRGGDHHQALGIRWLRIRADTSALMNGRFEPREVEVAYPELRLRRRADGTWNVEGLLADPWPGPPLPNPPRVHVKNGTVTLVDGDKTAAVLEDLTATITPTPEGAFRFEGTARGKAFEQARLAGTFDPESGRLALEEGELSRVDVGEPLRRLLPAEVHPDLERVGLEAGTIDLALEQLAYDPAATPPLRYAASARLRSARWGCPHLPFPLDNVSADLAIRDGLVTIADWAEGRNGKTVVRARPGGTIDVADPRGGPLDLTFDVADLELDGRLRDWTPRDLLMLWDEYQPRGAVSLAMRARRDRPGGPVGFGLGVDCRDVGIYYKMFPYPLEHIRGTLTWEGPRLNLVLNTLIGGKPAGAVGTIENPALITGPPPRFGPDADSLPPPPPVPDEVVVRLRFWAEGLPVDEALLKAMPPDVREVVDQFQPRGTVRGEARLVRTPPERPDDPPEGRVAIDADVRLADRCSIKWKELPFPVEELTGRLELHPDSWVFRDVRGRNGTAEITGEGDVQQVAPGQFQADLRIEADRLQFTETLKQALPEPWRAPWETLRPSGTCGIKARIKVHPGGVEPNYHLEIIPGRETRVELRLPSMVDPKATIDMPPMEQIKGLFVFDDGTVAMSDVEFSFKGAPARFVRGTVDLRDSGQFELKVENLEVDQFRLDQGLRKLMPPVMAQFARRLEDQTFRFRTNLGIGWSGQPGQPAWCTWDDALVIFNGNTIQTGLPLERLQGQIDHLRGKFDGQALTVDGMIDLEHASLLGQQLTRLRTPLHVAENLARLENIRGNLLGGELTGKVQATLDVTPEYNVALAVHGADLREYAKTLPGRQELGGRIDGWINVSGFGSDLHRLGGQGEAHLVEGKIGELPALLRLVSKIQPLRPSQASKVLFDAADAAFQIDGGHVRFDPIKLTGNAFSLQGGGTLSVQGQLDLSLRILAGRDEAPQIPLLSAALREAGAQLFQIRVQGTPANPNYDLLPLAPASAALRRTLPDRRARTTR